MITTMFRYIGKDPIYIHGHLNDEEVAIYQLEGWRMRVPTKSHRPSHKKPAKTQRNKNGIPVEKGAS